jgi:hypothetical protein
MTTALILLMGFTTAIIGLIFKVQNGQINRVFKFVHLLFLFLTVIAIILLTQCLSFRGFYTDRIIITVWFATGTALFGLFRKGSIKLILRMYYGFFFWLPIFFLSGWIIPQLRFMATVIGFYLAFDGEVNRFRINDKFQFQEAFQGVLASSHPMLDLIEKKGLFEKTTKAFIYRPGSEIKRINITALSNDSIKVSIITKDTINSYSDTTIRLPK